MYYQLQVCYTFAKENCVKDVIYHSVTETNAVRDAIAYANRLELAYEGYCKLTHIKIKEYIVSSIDESGNLITPVCPTIFSWNCKDVAALKRYIKDLRRKRDAEEDGKSF